MKIETSKELGALIRKKRQELRLTLRLAAPMCGVGIKFLHELETGKPTVQFDKALQVARGLGISLYTQE